MPSIESALLRAREFAGNQRRRIKYNAAIRGHAANTRSIVARLTQTYQPVTCPLVLVSQAERSGGSMLTLVVPTFNGKPIEANTSFAPMTPGSVSSAPTGRESFLSVEERAFITKTCMPLHARAMHELIEKV